MQPSESATSATSSPRPIPVNVPAAAGHRPPMPSWRAPRSAAALRYAGQMARVSATRIPQCVHSIGPASDESTRTHPPRQNAPIAAASALVLVSAVIADDASSSNGTIC